MVTESEGRDSDLDRFDLVVAQVWQLPEAFLHLILDPALEGLHLGEVLNVLDRLLLDPLVMLFRQVVLKELRLDVELNRVVASCDGLDIPLDIVVLLRLLDIIDIINDKQGNEDGGAAGKQALLLPGDHQRVIHYAGHLKEKERVLSRALLSIEALLVAHHEAVQILNLALGLADAILRQVSLQLLHIQERGALVGILEHGIGANCADLARRLDDSSVENGLPCVHGHVCHLNLAGRTRQRNSHVVRLKGGNGAQGVRSAKIAQRVLIETVPGLLG